MSFVQLDLHTEYSLVDSTIRIKSLLARVAELGMSAVAVTDNCNLFSLVKFFRSAEKAGIKPIVGADLWIAEEPDSAPYRLRVLCQNRRGYLSLSRLLSRAYLERTRIGRPVIQRQWLVEENSGLIALSGLQNGQLGQLLLSSNQSAAATALQSWMRLFDDRFYVQIARTGRENEAQYVQGALAIAAAAQCPVVASNPVRFLHEKDFDTHEARVCIHDGRTLDDPRRPRNYSRQQYLHSPEEMAELFHDLPEALENSVEIALRCNLELQLDRYFLPDFPVPGEQTIEDFLREQARSGLDRILQRLGPAPGFAQIDYFQRLDHELGVIIQMGFPGYFLIVADFIQWAKQNDIPVGPGRGSGAGSLVAYCLGITDLDPLRYLLLFERFLNPERVSMPDFDIDFCMERRDEVIDYVAQRYGRDRVCQIITYGSMTAKAVVRDAGRVLGHPYGLVDSIAKMIPMTLGVTLSQALEQEAELRERVRNEPEVSELLELAQSLEGLVRNAGKHAGGVVIAPSALTDFSPLYCDSVVSQFDKDDVESIGLVKFDFLGLRTLTIIDWAVKSINQQRQHSGEQPLDIACLQLDDEATFKLLKACNTTAVFQLESRGMKDLIRRLQPGSFDSIIALVALFRPGPLDSGMVDTFINCKRGRQQVTYAHPDLEPILEPTFGVILYQEQVMQIAQVLAGYTLGGADILRRAMGKKKPEEMAKQRQVFVSGAVARDVKETIAESIFDLMEKFAGYGFNKSHSAAYALLSFQTAWLKAHYPAQFMAAVLSSDMDSTDKVVNFIDDSRAQGLKLRPPDINSSNYAFSTADSSTINYGLGAIKGVGKAAIEAMTSERDRNGPYSNLMDFCSRVNSHKANKRVLEAMIHAGALDPLGNNRATLMHALPDTLRAADQLSRNQAAGQDDLFGTPMTANSPVPVKQLPEWPELQRLQGERDTLGLYLTGHPITPYLENLSQISSCRLGALESFYRPPQKTEKKGRRNPGQPCVLAGLVIAVRRRGDSMASVTIDDDAGRIEVVIYRDVLQECGELLHKDQILVVTGGLAIDHFNGGFQVKAQRLMTPEQAYQEFACAIHLELDCVAVDLPTLEQVLSKHAGGHTEVQATYGNGDARVTLIFDEQWRVRVSPVLVADLDAAPGVVSTRIIFRKPSMNLH